MVQLSTTNDCGLTFAGLERLDGQVSSHKTGTASGIGWNGRTPKIEVVGDTVGGGGNKSREGAVKLGIILHGILSILEV